MEGVDRRTYRTYEPVSLCPAAPGWRAVYFLEDDGPDEPGWHARPLAAWGVFQVMSRPVKGSVADEKNEGHHICGVTADDWAESAEAMGNFWRYLSPDDPDPSPEEVARKRGVAPPG
jgi:hypothetical protein